jgi:hypothetical protein
MNNWVKEKLRRAIKPLRNAAWLATSRFCGWFSSAG